MAETMIMAEIIEGSSNFIGYKHTMSLKFTTLRLDGTWTPPQKISLYGVPPFNEGDGVIDEPKDVFQTSPKDGHTLFGFQWDQVYPDFIDFVHDNLVITGRDFKINSIINFTKKVITPPSTRCNARLQTVFTKIAIRQD